MLLGAGHAGVPGTCTCLQHVPFCLTLTCNPCSCPWREILLRQRTGLLLKEKYIPSENIPALQSLTCLFLGLSDAFQVPFCRHDFLAFWAVLLGTPLPRFQRLTHFTSFVLKLSEWNVENTTTPTRDCHISVLTFMEDLFLRVSNDFWIYHAGLKKFSKQAPLSFSTFRQDRFWVNLPSWRCVSGFPTYGVTSFYIKLEPQILLMENIMELLSDFGWIKWPDWQAGSVLGRFIYLQQTSGMLHLLFPFCGFSSTFCWASSLQPLAISMQNRPILV